MPDHLRPRCRVLAALAIGLAAAYANAQPPAANRAVMEPLSGVQVGYERLGPATSASPAGRFDGSLATPVGTLRTTVQAAPVGERQFERGDITLDWPTHVFGGQLQLRELQAGGAGAAWRGRLDAGLTAETRCNWMPERSGQALQLKQDFGDGQEARAILSRSRTPTAQGSRWDVEVIQEAGLARWMAGVDSAEQGYVSPAGGPEPRVGVRLGTQWRLFPFSRMELRYTFQVRGEAEERVSSVMVGTRFDLPLRVSLVTGLETDGNDRHKASLTLAVPLEIR